MDLSEINKYYRLVKVLIFLGSVFLIVAISVFMFGNSIINYQMHQVILIK